MRTELQNSFFCVWGLKTSSLGLFARHARAYEYASHETYSSPSAAAQDEERGGLYTSIEESVVGEEETLTVGATRIDAGGSSVNARGGGYKCGYEFLRYARPSGVIPNSELEAELSTGEDEAFKYPVVHKLTLPLLTPLLWGDGA